MMGSREHVDAHSDLAPFGQVRLVDLVVPCSCISSRPLIRSTSCILNGYDVPNPSLIIRTANEEEENREETESYR